MKKILALAVLAGSLALPFAASASIDSHACDSAHNDNTDPQFQLCAGGGLSAEQLAPSIRGYGNMQNQMFSADQFGSDVVVRFLGTHFTAGGVLISSTSVGFALDSFSHAVNATAPLYGYQSRVDASEIATYHTVVLHGLKAGTYAIRPLISGSTCTIGQCPTFEALGAEVVITVK